MSLLGNGLSDASHDEEALSVKEAELSMELRLGAPVEHILAVHGLERVLEDSRATLRAREAPPSSSGGA